MNNIYEVAGHKFEFKEKLTMGDRSKIFEMEDRLQDMNDRGILWACETFALLCVTIDDQLQSFQQKYDFMLGLTDVEIYAALVKFCHDLKDKIASENEEKKKTLTTSVDAGKTPGE